MCPPSAFGSSDNAATPIPSETLTSAVPSTTISKAAFELAASLLSPAILNHSLRVFLYAKILAEKTSSAYFLEPAQLDLLFTACILHDIGTTNQYDGEQRFEVEGADAAVGLLEQYDIKGKDAHDVWVAIAIHTSPQIAERISELAKIVRLAVLFDFNREEGFAEAVKNVDLKSLRAERENEMPRLGIEKVLGDAVVAQALKRPRKAPPASWPNNLYRAHLAEPEWKGVNKGF
ncbi:hypothetical protein BDV96DRAFT_564538 [Lophiotrema nucula]|uniref:HD domain-containing protein n=1 Tax=Lophiotrema nucula TaxID=690887 RepID=A0A6A5ZQ10_9PLEO|nr:hypothetical protein BDV96DRAFT_564538 [Lophiotrema nucula]